jgi:hypothetical protein
MDLKIGQLERCARIRKILSDEGKMWIRKLEIVDGKEQE